MASYKFLVLTNAVPGSEAEFARWYDEVHLRDVLAVPGFVSAQRFALDDAGTGELGGYRFLAIYDMESDDPDATMAALRARAGTDAMVISPAMDPKAGMSRWRAITALHKARE